MCFRARSSSTPPILAGVCGVDVCAWARISAAPAIPGWGVWVSVCLCARSACTPPILAGMRGVGVCAPAWVSAAPRHSWLGCWGLRVGLHLLPVPRLSWLGCWGVCVSVCALLPYPASPSFVGRCRCVCLSSGFCCAPLFVVGALEFVCFCARGPLVARESRLGCGCLCLGSGFGLAPQLLTGLLRCVCRRARSVRTLPLLAGVCCVRVGCCLEPVSVPWFVAGCPPRPSFRHPVGVVAWHRSGCLGCGQRVASLAYLVAPHWCATPPSVQSL